ncbi:MAG TPA: ABC transporter ATP-binding protein [Pyrinomonadaceae bacterium]|jgi:ABC-type Fe3+/spermidine/putrescine transport system ATPase subunit|nr:ABC transporter ATP-binding protein [Pyrinomonadaceae bacterium]
MGILNLQGLSKRFGDNWVLRDLSAQVEPGEIFGVLGTPGSGKSTLLRIIAGLEAPGGGAISFENNDISTLTVSGRRFAIVPQESSLFTEQTVFDNVASGLKAKGLSQDELAKKTHEALLYVGLEELAGAKPDTLSESDKLMVALARALAVEPKLLIIDSPFGDLDITAKEYVLEKYHHAIKGAGVTAICAARDYVEAFALCDRVGIMHRGEIIQTAPPRDIYEHPKSVHVAQMLGRNNFITARRISFNNADIQEFQTQNGDHRLRTDKMEQRVLGAITHDVTLAIRPENISISFGASFPEDNLLKAVVKEVHYQGATTRIVLDADGLMLEALVLRLVGLNLFDECMVGLPPDRILVLKD